MADAPETQAEIKRVGPRIQGHVDRLREAGLDTQMFFDALVGIRDDTALSTAQRDALYKLVAMESFIWYLEALRGEPVDRIKLAEESVKKAQENAVAIKKREPGDTAAALVQADVTQRDLRIPETADTLVDRPPPVSRPAPKVKPADDGPTRVDRPPKRK